jgi:DNA-binding phage protein
MTRSSAAELLGQLLREHAIRARAALEMYEREHGAIQGLARNAVRHGLPVATVAREAGVSRQTLHKWLRGGARGPRWATGRIRRGSGGVWAAPGLRTEGRPGTYCY